MPKKMIRILHVLNSLDRGGAESMLMNYYLFLARIYGKYVIDHSHSVERNRSEQQLIHNLRYFIYWLTRYISNRFLHVVKKLE